MTETTEPYIAYTEDCEGLSALVIETFGALGISVQHFPTNDMAKAYFAEGQGLACSGLMVDQITTGGQLTGILLIKETIGMNICQEVMVLSSSENRLALITTLEREVDKIKEHAVAALYMAIRIFYPAIPVARRVLLEHFGFELDELGDTTVKAVALNAEIRTKLVHGELTLSQIALELAPSLGYITVNNIPYSPERAATLKTRLAEPSLIAIPSSILGHSLNSPQIFCPLAVDRLFEAEQLAQGMDVKVSKRQDARFPYPEPDKYVKQGEMYILDESQCRLVPCKMERGVYNLRPSQRYYLLPSDLAASFNRQYAKEANLHLE